MNRPLPTLPEPLACPDCGIGQLGMADGLIEDTVYTASQHFVRKAVPGVWLACSHCEFTHVLGTEVKAVLGVLTRGASV